MDIEKFIQSKEVQNQSLTPEEVNKILNTFGISEFAEFDGMTETMTPVFKAFKTQLFNYALDLVKFEFEFLDFEHREICILDDTNILDLVAEIVNKFDDVLEQNL